MSFVPNSYGLNPAIPTPTAPPTSGTQPLAGANPAPTAAPYSPINATAQGMPAPAAVGSYKPGPQTNQFGSWGGAADSGIPGDTNGSPQGAPSSSGSGWSYSAPGSTSGGSSTSSATVPGAANPESAYASGGGGAGYFQGPGVKYASENGYGGQGPMLNSAQAAGNWLKTLGDPTTGIYGGSGLSNAEGGPIPGIDHTSKAVSFDDGGSVPDPGGAIPSDPSDPSDVSDFSTTDGGDSAQQPDEGQSIMASIYNTLSYGRQKSGLSDAIINQVYGPGGAGDGNDQLAGNIPGKPAGPGGDQPSQDPFQTKTPAPPFGQRVAANSGPIQPSPGTGGKPAQGALQPAPFNPRDYLPGGAKSSDAGGIPDDTETS